ncbi:hypothetical protein SAMD00019534_059340 [Acytostelium subglobosum LB1]|uniref:hypothetical protein n=1 Tax=Acytostelium subglobosum LB1 TaxID=1410327 RepID=UPI000644B8F0|nr:hypothetical protein SAMD00019534_059340 [Acytostelium subglobosum LB1]GAM22759.1 hypothetical protein SAMD00019534_059340 [Acytostelium subglobosum LB1]|eukprot:XP_012753986.1 hypothetical protein SAMD00019534_059340 [Acytostelium subglobosum LB1]
MAEKDKMDSIKLLNGIKEYKEQIAAYIKDFYEDDQFIHSHGEPKDKIERYKVLTAIESTSLQSPQLSGSPKISSMPSLSSYLHGHVHTAHQGMPSINLSFWGSSSQQHEKTKNKEESVSDLMSSFQNKDVELDRVKCRSTLESMKVQNLQEKFTELSHLVRSEKDKWGLEVQCIRSEINNKEKEIGHLLRVAENHKKTSMDNIDHITKLKRSLASICNLRGGSSRLDINRLNESFSFENLCPGGQSQCTSVHNHLGSSSSSSSLSSSSSSSGSDHGITHSNDRFWTEEKRDIAHLNKQLLKKDEEIKRVKDIIYVEMRRSNYLGNKLIELKSLLEEESRQVDYLELKAFREVKEKEDAVVRVAYRAQKDRLRSAILRGEVQKLSAILQHEEPVSRRRYALQDGDTFSEMGDLSQFSNISLAQFCSEGYRVTPQRPKPSNNHSLLPWHVHHINTLVNENKFPSSPTHGEGKLPLANLSFEVESFLRRSHQGSIPTASSPLSPSMGRMGRRNSEVISPVHNHHARTSSSYTHDQSTGHSHGHGHGHHAQSHSHAHGHGHPSPSEVIQRKLLEIEEIYSLASLKDMELVKIKKIAEAERSKYLILREKYRQLMEEYNNMISQSMIHLHSSNSSTSSTSSSGSSHRNTNGLGNTDYRYYNSNVNIF